MPEFPEYTESCRCGSDLNMRGVIPTDAKALLNQFREAHTICRTTPTVELRADNDLTDAIRHVQNMNYNEVATPVVRCTCETQDAEVADIYGNHHIRSCPLYIPHTTVQRTTS